MTCDELPRRDLSPNMDDTSLARAVIKRVWRQLSAVCPPRPLSNFDHRVVQNVDIEPAACVRLSIFLVYLVLALLCGGSSRDACSRRSPYRPQHVLAERRRLAAHEMKGRPSKAGVV